MSQEQFGTGNTVTEGNYFKPFVKERGIKITKIYYDKHEASGKENCIIEYTRPSDGASCRQYLSRPSRDKVKAKGNRSADEMYDFMVKLYNTNMKHIASQFLPPEEAVAIKGASFKQFIENMEAALRPHYDKVLLWAKIVKNHKGFSTVSDNAPFLMVDTGQDISQVNLPFTDRDYKYKDVEIARSSKDTTEHSGDYPENAEDYRGNDSEYEEANVDEEY